MLAQPGADIDGMNTNRRRGGYALLCILDLSISISISMCMHILGHKKLLCELLWPAVVGSANVYGTYV